MSRSRFYCRPDASKHWKKSFSLNTQLTIQLDLACVMSRCFKDSHSDLERILKWLQIQYKKCEIEDVCGNSRAEFTSPSKFRWLLAYYSYYCLLTVGHCKETADTHDKSGARPDFLYSISIQCEALIIGIFAINGPKETLIMHCLFTQAFLKFAHSWLHTCRLYFMDELENSGFVFR